MISNYNDKLLRIAHIESSMHWGGQELRIVEQTEWLNNQGYPTWIIARPGSAIVEKAREKSLPLHEMPIRGSFNPSTFRKLLDFLRRNKIELLDCHGNRDGRYGAYVRWLTRISVIRSRHIIDPIRNDFFSRLVWRYGNDGIIVTADEIRKMIAASGLSKSDRIYVAVPGVDEKRFHPGLCGLSLRQKLGIPPHHFVIANIGMIRPDKGQLQFVAASRMLLKKHSDMTCIQVGEAPSHSLKYKDEVVDSAGEDGQNGRIRFLGYQSDIENWLALADVVVIASIATEAKTRLVAQAFLMKKNVVATTIGGLSEMIAHNHTGLLCQPDDSTALAQAVEVLMDDKELAKGLRENAYQQAIQSMTFECMMSGMLAAYNQATRSSKA
jgi:glycosyltransferase involved in cell wall biosynthesis